MLNKKQKIMVNLINKSLVTIAGPGSGKTHTLTEKIYELTKKTDINKILLLTFTNSAASEIKERIVNRLSQKPNNNLYFGTYHSIFKRLLISQNIFEEIEFCKNPTIITPNEILRLFSNQVKNLLKTDYKDLTISAISNYTEEYCDESDINRLTKTIFEKEIINIYGVLNLIDNKINFISKEDIEDCNNINELYIKLKELVKELLLEEIQKTLDYDKNDSFIFGSSFINFVKLDDYEMNQTKIFLDTILSNLFNKKIEEEIITFSDILLLTLFSLLRVKSFKENVSKFFEYIYIDEFQDTNIIQYNILKIIYNSNNNKLQVIGDPYQSIFSFLGAEVKNILNIKRELKTELLQLDTNYRSSENIVMLTNYLSTNMNEKIEGLKPCKSGRTDIKNHKIKLHQNFNKYDNKNDSLRQRDFLIEKIKKYLKKGKTIGIINRTAKDYKTENILTQENLNFTKLGGISLKESVEIQVLIHLFKYSINNEKKSSLIYILENTKGIGQKSIENYFFNNKTNQKIDLIIKYIKKFNEETVYSDKIIKLFNFYQKNLFSNLSRQWKEDRVNIAKTRIDFLMDEIKEKNNNEDLQILLDNYLLDDTNKKEKNNQITISTIHSAKGLEWDIVFLTDWNDDNFKRDDINEGQRLNYVAISRAKEKLYILSDNENFYNLSDNDIYKNQELFDLTNHMTQSFDEIYYDKNTDIQEFVTFGKFKKIKFNKMPKYYLNWLSDNSQDLIEKGMLDEFQLKMIEDLI